MIQRAAVPGHDMYEREHEHERWHKRLLILAALLRSIGKPHLRDAADVLQELASDLAAGEDDAATLIQLVETFTTTDPCIMAGARRIGLGSAAMDSARRADIRWAHVKRSAEGQVSDE
jgi:hypothetical protein